MGKFKPPVQWGQKMGKNILPIDAFRDQILMCIKENPVTIITAETGAGKSTQVPQYLLDEGYDLVVTQPRRLAARSVATRVAYEMGEKIGATIGYRTAVERVDSPQTRCLFCTDGLALVRELMGQNKGILVLDEVHEWNENMEVLVAWVKSQIATSTMKVILMSATLEAEKLSAYFNNAPIISVPGRTFEVENRMAGRDVETDVATLVVEGRNVLVFQPGQQEINETINRLEQLKVSAIILPLHGQLTPEEQAKCFAHYGKPKVIVSTNVAQTSVTIDDIDAVVDSGFERRIELVDGVEGLYLKAISLADAKQRKGRAGRTKVGIYIDHCSSSTRSDFPVAEILRKRLDQTVLRLAIAGFDMEAMEFFHQPAKSDIHDARKTLIGLGCMTTGSKVTAIGRLVNKLPVSVKYGRMLVEADRLGVINDILTVAAIMEMDGITVPPPSRNRPDRPDWRKMVPDEEESDIMAQLKVWEMSRTMNESQMKEKGISLRNLYRAKEIRQTLSDALKGHFHFGTNGNRENILKAVCAGMVDHLYKREYGSYRNGDDTERELGSSSVVERSIPNWIVGIPFDLQITTRRGSMTLNLVSMASKVNPAWLAEVAPHMVSNKVEKLYWSSEQKCVVEDHVMIFNGQEIARVEKPALWSEEAFKILVSRIITSSSSSDIVNELYRLNTEIMNQYDVYCIRGGGAVEIKNNSEVIGEHYRKLLEPYKVLSFSHLEKLLEKEVSKDDLRIKLSDMISQEEITSIEVNNPLVIEVEGKEFSVIYSYYSGNFIAKCEVTENFILETKLESISLLSGRELKLSCNGYTQTLNEHRARIEKTRQEELEKAKRNLVSNFNNQISEALTVPHVEIFYMYWSLTELGNILKNRLGALKVEMIEGLTLENYIKRVEMVKIEAEEIKNELRLQYENAKVLITKTEESFEKSLANVEHEFVSDEARIIQGQIYQAKNALQKADFTEVENICREIEHLAANLLTLTEMRKNEREELIRNNNIPGHLLDAFHGGLDCTLEFIKNVAKIETRRLNEHELTCGRSRARQICEDAWSAMGETSDFFCGADPNDVKYYIYEHHFGEDSTLVVRREEKGSYNNNLSTSNNPIEEALRRAGLIK